MSKKIMIAWGFVIFLMIFTIFFIGLKEKDIGYLKFRFNLIVNTRKYIKDNNLTPKLNAAVVVFSDDLIKENYVSEKSIDNYCVIGVTVYNKLFIDEYTINRECEKDIK